MTADRIDRVCRDDLNSHYEHHPNVAVVLVADLVGAHDIAAGAPYDAAAVVRAAELPGTPNLLQGMKALAAPSAGGPGAVTAADIPGLEAYVAAADRRFAGL
ncbi:hypothetical protein ACFV19_06845 [Streptomyces griseoluteus]|uniref:hypothetical protein n=1 Tax=Streptomyces griseoluteus TaxID=29306 RepID=UPI0036B04180